MDPWVKVEDPRPGIRTSRGRVGDLLLLQADPVRPCSGCTIACSDASHPATCGCGCSPSCAEAPRRLSIEPSRYPVEPHILPIVFALFGSGLAQPCWSCEGHNHAGGTLYKWPGVWFYSNSITYLDLLRTTLAALHDTHRTHRAWEVHPCDWQPHPAATLYVLGPNRAVSEPTLSALHEDLVAVGQGLATDVRALASGWMATG